MHSISEPFGIAPLEAIRADVPVIISKQSGVAEVLPHALKVDFWDSDNLLIAIHGLLNHNGFADHNRSQNRKTLQQLTWDNAAVKVAEGYASVA